MIHPHDQTSFRHRSPWALAVSFALLAVYLLGAFQSTSIHHFIHGGSTELHSDKNEGDACHKAIYHHSAEKCGHKLHISSAERCSMCHLVFHFEQILPEKYFTLVADDNVVAIASHYSLTIDSHTSGLSCRAPPVG